ncbi:MAG: replication restart DNA helicase PriA [Tildeniella nuda ZEHNDER 1965/U140]|nr:replication restart DNA helicase PriA [Tildeniella nuda ZEHNDER 1965/U140]
MSTVLDLETPTALDVHCPNCGSHAERYYLTIDHLTRTQCSACDYLMVTCSQTGRVIEAYAPGLYACR